MNTFWGPKHALNVVLLALAEAVKAMSPGSDYTVMYYYGSEGGAERLLPKETKTRREDLYGVVFEQLNRGAIREYKRIICFDTDVLANDHELKSASSAWVKVPEPSTA